MKYRLLDFATLYQRPSTDSPPVIPDDIDPQAEVRAWGQNTNQEVASPEVMDGFVYVERRGNKGWVLESLLGDFVRPAVEPADAVLACVAAEADVNGLEDTAPWFVSADFLIARALLETGLSNTATRASGPDAFGPMLVTAKEWQLFLDECSEKGEFTSTGWNDPIEQVWAAAYRMRRDAKAIGELKRGAGGGAGQAPFLPTLLDVFHAYLTNSPKAAVALLDAGPGDAGKPVAEILGRALPPQEVDAVFDGLNARPDAQGAPLSFGKPSAPLSLGAALDKTGAALDKLLRQAAELLSKHAPEVVPAAGPGPRPQPGSTGSAPPSFEVTGPAGGPLGTLIARHEGDYGSFNRGRAGDSRGKKIDFSTMTLGQIMDLQSLPRDNSNRLFAVGKYQIIPQTMRDAARTLGLDRGLKFTPALQEHLFRNYLMARKRPQVKRYIVGNGGDRDLQAAQLALAQEFASVASPFTGRSYYAGSGGNAAATTAAQVANALAEERRMYRGFTAAGKTPEQAWNALSAVSGDGVPVAAAASEGAPAAGPASTPGRSGLDIKAAIAQLRKNAQPHSTGMCARYVRLALAAGGLNIDPHPAIAKEYGPYLTKHGCIEVPLTNYSPAPGDIVVIQNYPGGKNAGHIAMYTGSEWISDFRQRDMWAGPGYRSFRPKHAIYRP